MDESHTSHVSYNLHEGLHGGSSETLLLDSLSTSSVGPFLFACAVLALVAFGLEMARFYASNLENSLKRSKDERRNLITYNCDNNYSTMNVSSDEENRKTEVIPTILSSSNDEETLEKNSILRVLKTWIVLGALYSSTYFLSVMLMLITMTYNIYLILSICLGVTAGKLFSLYLQWKD